MNLDFVKELQPWFNGELAVLLQDGTTLPVSRTHRTALQDLD